MDTSSRILKLFETGNSVMLFVWRNADGWPPEYVSQNVKNALGYDPQLFLDRKLIYADLIHEDDLPRVFGEVMDASNNPTTSSFVHEDYRLRCADGQYRWYVDTTYIERDANGKPRYYIGYLVDVTDRKAMELELAENKTRLELVLEGTRLGLWDWNPQTNAVRFNERWAQMLGLDYPSLPQELSTWESRVHPDDIASCFADITAHLQGEVDFYENVHRMRHADGSWRYILDRGKVVEWDEQGNPIRFTGTHTDITREKEAEFRANEAAKAKSIFLANMSHEIRTPLNGILGLISLLETTALNDQQRQYIKTVKDSGKLLNDIINDILDISKIEAGRLELEYKPLNLPERLKHCFDLFNQRADSKRIDYQLRLDEKLPKFIASDATRIVQIVSNLLSNALKFTDHGHVHLIASFQLDNGSDDHGQLQLQVSDSGRGIADTSRIWDDFVQEDASITRQYGGTGLGLTIVRSLCEKLGGSIEVQSQLGAGSLFTVHLPAQVVAESHEEHHLSQGYINPKLSILLTEDNHTNQLVMMAMLKQLGLPCDLAENGKQAVEQAARKHYDLIFMDLQMPVMDGFAATTQILANDSERLKPIIVAMSADVFDETRAQCLAAGMHSFIAKPFQREELIDCLERISQQLESVLH